MSGHQSCLIIGPFHKVGGREVEANLIYHAIQDSCKPYLYSTHYMDSSSQAAAGVPESDYGSLHKSISESSWIARLFSSLISIFRTGSLESRHAFVKSGFFKQFMGGAEIETRLILDQLEGKDLIICCMQPSSKFLKVITAFADEHRIPVILRVTGTVPKLNIEAMQWMQSLELIWSHSEVNKRMIQRLVDVPVQIIDQTTDLEEDLLQIPVLSGPVRKFGYLGRFSSEKGIKELLQNFPRTDHLRLYVAGEGPLQKEVTDWIGGRSDIELLGVVQKSDLKSFYQMIDCLIIPSLEEAGPVVGVESMAAARPVLSTLVGAMPERMEDTSNQYWIDWNEPGSLHGSSPD